MGERRSPGEELKSVWVEAVSPWPSFLKIKGKGNITYFAVMPSKFLLLPPLKSGKEEVPDVLLIRIQQFSYPGSIPGGGAEISQAAPCCAAQKQQ